MPPLGPTIHLRILSHYPRIFSHHLYATGATSVKVSEQTANLEDADWMSLRDEDVGASRAEFNKEFQTRECCITSPMRVP